MRLLALLSLLLVAPLAAQSNQVPGTDARLAASFSLAAHGRLGTHPNGMNGISAGVTVCNVGSTTLDWRAPMDDRHPVYAFMLLRESDGRIEQISDRSYVKHGFASINGSHCGSCSTGTSRQLGPNCSDTYGTGLNADRYYLGPADEIDPWLGVWGPVGSHFDRGQPDVGAPANQDGRRSLTRTQVAAMDPVEHRIEVADADLAVPGARYFYVVYIVVRGEPEANRANNMIVREVRPTWSGSRWTFTDVGGASSGTLLNRWSGARLSSVANGNDDGRFHVGVRVSGPDARGMWHYEYAIHNRDNAGGAAGFRLPICPDARIENATFRDIDDESLNDWQISAQNGELAFLAPAGNALEWNTVYNFAFDCDAGPASGTATIDQARPGSGALQLAVTTEVPGLAFSPFAGSGCGAPAPGLYATGMPPIPTIPNPAFGLRIEGAASGASLGLLFGTNAASQSLGGGCVLHLAPATALGSVSANGNGVASWQLPVPNLPALEGRSLFFQTVELAQGGPLFGAGELSNAIQVRIGNQTSGCR